MTTPEALAKLCAGSCDLTDIRVDGNAVPAHTIGELAGALAHCSEGARLYGAVFYRDAHEYRGRLMSEIRYQLAGIADRKGWEIRKPGILEGLAWLGMAEESPESSRCPTCGGIGSKTIQSRVIEFPPCDGSGRRKITKAHEWLGCDRKHWERVWRGRYEDHVRPMLGEWRFEVRKALWDELKTEE